jgi:hypothetical protein
MLPVMDKGVKTHKQNVIQTSGRITQSGVNMDIQRYKAGYEMRRLNESTMREALTGSSSVRPLGKFNGRTEVIVWNKSCDPG